MTRTSDLGAVSPAARERAVEWHVRLQSDAAEEADWQAFEAWLDESSEHAAAYAEVDALWSELDDAPAQPAEIVTLKPRVAARRGPPRWAWPAAIAASLAIAAGVALNVGDFGGPAPVTYETAKGATREITLADGTHVRLNSGSKISVALGRHERRVEMADAEAAFDVTHDPSRPFIIAAGDRRIRVVGTEFDVLRHGGQVSVSVRRGVVEVRAAQADAAGPPIARLTRGQRLEHTEGAAGDRVGAVDPDKAFAWTQGRLVYEDARLEDVAADLNRYVAAPIVVAPEARNLRLSAVIDLDTEDAMVRRLAGFLPVSAVRDGDVYRIGLRPTQP
ncbi:FecR family protein [Phenylobacterium soli]|uniref:Iron dicitrate transport regulator FecR n=1 Tax=Phenylobacterium soli TaxID=2170551 RepID=A0A328AK88_9CAUL|nr:FecR domain-containing protein [Phenylobacterium soli]RAK54805.1 iron dicitrate transport regulator FecR [Phenylobacterium soli]